MLRMSKRSSSKDNSENRIAQTTRAAAVQAEPFVLNEESMVDKARNLLNFDANIGVYLTGFPEVFIQTYINSWISAWTDKLWLQVGQKGLE